MTQRRPVTPSNHLPRKGQKRSGSSTSSKTSRSTGAQKAGATDASKATDATGTPRAGDTGTPGAGPTAAAKAARAPETSRPPAPQETSGGEVAATETPLTTKPRATPATKVAGAPGAATTRAAGDAATEAAPKTVRRTAGSPAGAGATAVPAPPAPNRVTTPPAVEEELVVAAPGVAAPGGAAGRSAPVAAGAGLARVHPKRELRRRRVAWILAGLAAVAVITVGVIRANKSTPAPTTTLVTHTLLRLPATSDVTGVAEGDGAGFATDAQRDLLLRFNTATGRVEASVTLPGRPSALLLDGTDLWVADSTNNEVTVVNAQTMHVVGSAALAGSPTSLAVVGANLWVTTAGADGITPIALQTGVVGTPVPVLSGAVRVAAGFDALWTTGTVDRLTRVVPSTDGGAPVQRAVVVGRGPTAVAAGVDAVWVANTQAGTVSRVDPNTMTVTGTYKVGADPDSIAVAPDGQVVVGYSSGTVVEVLGIASKSQVLDVGTHPQDVVTAGSGVWVAGSHPGRVATAA